MSNISRRIDKIEGKVQSIKKDDDDRKARLLEIEHLEGQDSLRAAMLRLELAYGHTFSLVDVVAMVTAKQTKDFRRDTK